MQNMFTHQMVIWLLESVGISCVVSVGNEAVGVKIADFPWLLHDVFCVIIMMHMLGLQCAWNLVLFGLWWCHHLFCPSVIMGRARVWRIMQLRIISRALCRVLFYCFIVTWAGLISFLLLWVFGCLLEFAFLCMLLCVWLYACNSACGHCTMHGSQPVSSPG